MKMAKIMVQLKERDILEAAMVKVVSLFDVEVVTDLVDADQNEADIYLTDDIDMVLRALKETENTTVAMFSVNKKEIDAAMSFAEKFPERVVVVGTMRFVFEIAQIIEVKSKNKGETA